MRIACFIFLALLLVVSPSAAEPLTNLKEGPHSVVCTAERPAKFTLEISDSKDVWPVDPYVEFFILGESGEVFVLRQDAPFWRFKVTPADAGAKCIVK